MPDRPRSRLRQFGPALLLLVSLAAAVAIRPGDPGGAVQLANPDLTRVSELRAALARLPDPAMVVVGMDPDLGTYPEIRPAVRAAFDDLLRRRARLAFISFSPEGRAIAAVEMGRLRRAGTDEASVRDLGFVTGVEAGMIRAVTDFDLADFDLALVVGGGDVGPRTWVEQVGSRLPDLPMVAIAPTSLQPELQPYLRTGQLAGMLATVRDGSAYAAVVGRERPTSEPEPGAIGGPPSALAMLLGMLIALGVLSEASAGGAITAARRAWLGHGR